MIIIIHPHPLSLSSVQGLINHQSTTTPLTLMIEDKTWVMEHKHDSILGDMYIWYQHLSASTPHYTQPANNSPLSMPCAPSLIAASKLASVFSGNLAEAYTNKESQNEKQPFGIQNSSSPHGDPNSLDMQPALFQQRAATVRGYMMIAYQAMDGQLESFLWIAGYRLETTFWPCNVCLSTVIE